MTWIKHTFPEPIHTCRKPGLSAQEILKPPHDTATVGDVWACDDCEEQWIVTGKPGALEWSKVKVGKRLVD